MALKLLSSYSNSRGACTFEPWGPFEESRTLFGNPDRALGQNDVIGSSGRKQPYVIGPTPKSPKDQPIPVA